MKNTVKLCGLIALTALIGFAACDSGNGPGNPEGDITWTAVADGTSNTATSSKITFTFSAAVSGLTKSDITLTNGTGSVSQGELTASGSENKVYDLGITVATAGTISVKVTKTGISAAAQNVTVHKQQGGEAVNPISAGRKTYVNDGEQVVFSAPTGNGGTYTLNGQKRGDDGNFVYDENNKYMWQAKAEGSYTWDQSAQTLTLTAEKIADNDGVMTAKANALSLFQGWMEEEIDSEIENRIAWSANLLGETRDDAKAAVLESRNETNGTAYTTMDELINALAEIRFDEMFAPRSYTYTFSNDNESLILLAALPPPVGTDEFAGKTFNGTISNLMGESSKNPNHTFVFSAAGTYTETSSGEFADETTASAGSYSYDSMAKRVYLKPMARNGLSPEQFYDEANYYPEYDRLPEADSRASQTYQHFRLWNYDYDPATNVIDTKDSGEIEGL